MATRYAVASGNWSSVSTWDGGASIPASTDDVYANSYAVEIDQNVTVNSFRNITGSGIVAGGTFNVTNAASNVSITVTAGILAAHIGVTTTGVVRITNGTVALTASMTGGGTANYKNVVITGGTTTVTGSLTGGAGDASQCIYATGGTTIINGSVTGGSNGTSGGAGLSVSNGGTVTVNGDIFGGNPWGYGIYVDLNGILNINNSTITTTSQVAVLANNTSTVTVRNATLLGAAVQSNTAAINTVSGVTLTLYDSFIQGGQAATAYGIISNGTTTISGGTIIGGTGSASAYGIYASSGSIRIDAEMIYGATGCAPLSANGVQPQFMRSGTHLKWTLKSDDNWPNATGNALSLTPAAVVPTVAPTGQLWPGTSPYTYIAPSQSTPSPQVVFSQNTSGSGTHTYTLGSSVVQKGDIILLFSSGAYRVTSTTPAMTMLYDGGSGGLAMTSSAFGMVAGATVPATVSCVSSDANETSALIVIRNLTGIGEARGQTLSGSSTTPLTFGSAPSESAQQRKLAVMYFGVAASAPSFTIVPTPTTSIYTNVTTPGGRAIHLYLTSIPNDRVYSATPASTTYKSGVVVQLY